MKTSSREYMARARAERPEWVAEIKHRSYLKHKERVLAKSAARYAKHREQRKTQAAAYRAAVGPEEMKRRKRAYYLEHREEIKAKSRAYRLNLPIEERQRRFRIFRQRPEARAALTKDRARRRGITHPVDAATTRKVAAIRSGLTTCHWCHRPIDGRNGKETHIDHVIPISKGGTHAADNLVPACPTCNMRKGSKLPSDFKPKGTTNP